MVGVTAGVSKCGSDQYQSSDDKAKEVTSGNNESERKAFAHPHHYPTRFGLDFTFSQAA
jgi:hypothetical protein